MTNDNYKSD